MDTWSVDMLTERSIKSKGTRYNKWIFCRQKDVLRCFLIGDKVSWGRQWEFSRQKGQARFGHVFGVEITGDGWSTRCFCGVRGA